MKTQEQKLQLLDETIAYYSKGNKRCASSMGCRYSGKTVGIKTQGCAVGRLLKPALRIELDKNSGIVTYSRIWEKLPKNIQSYGQDFLRQLQMLHDDASFWGIKGLSSGGEFFVKELRQKINNNKL